MYKARIFLMGGIWDRTQSPPEITLGLKRVDLMFYEEPTEELVRGTLATFIPQFGGAFRCLPKDASLKFTVEECTE